MRSRRAPLMLIAICATAVGCIEESTSGSESVRETGYVECGYEPGSCEQGLVCTGEAGRVCVTEPSASAPSLCSTLCGLVERCDFRQVAVCLDGDPSPDNPRRDTCVLAQDGQAECEARCAEGWAANEQADACQLARQRALACQYATECANAEEPESANCATARGEEVAACADEAPAAPFVAVEGVRPTLTSIVAPAACTVGAELAEVDVSVLLFGGSAGQERPMSETSAVEDFAFNQLSVQRDGDGDLEPVTLTPTRVEYRPLGGADPLADKLVVLVVDHSGSLIGMNPRDGRVFIENANDRLDARMAFLQRLTAALPARWYTSLVWFNGLPMVTPEYATPTRNRDVTSEGLTGLQTGETGTTALADALMQSYRRIVAAEQNADLAPVIVLFTDGVEDGDTSTGTLAEARAAILAHVPPVPVIVLQLQPNERSELPRGRDPALVELACASGGAYLFLDDPSEFVDPIRNLNRTVLGLLHGAWQLRAQTDLVGVPGGSIALSGELSATVGESTQTTVLGKIPTEGRSIDTRLWLTR